MKNISFLLMMVAITSLLVAGITSTTMQADAFLKVKVIHKREQISVPFQVANSLT